MDEQAVPGIGRKTLAAEHRVRSAEPTRSGSDGGGRLARTPRGRDPRRCSGRVRWPSTSSSTASLHLVTVRRRLGAAPACLAASIGVALEVETLRFALQRMTSSWTPRVAAAHEGAARAPGEPAPAPGPRACGARAGDQPGRRPAGAGVGIACLALRARGGERHALGDPVVPRRRGRGRPRVPPGRVRCRPGAACGGRRGAGQRRLLARPPRCWVREARRWRPLSRSLEGASIVHVAAHGHLRADNPLLSSLELADGPLTVYDLERLARVPAVVLMPACRSAVGAVRSATSCSVSLRRSWDWARGLWWPRSPRPGRRDGWVGAPGACRAAAGLRPATALAEAGAGRTPEPGRSGDRRRGSCASVAGPSYRATRSVGTRRRRRSRGRTASAPSRSCSAPLALAFMVRLATSAATTGAANEVPLHGPTMNVTSSSVVSQWPSTYVLARSTPGAQTSTHDP